ncbi:MAG: DMT family transporter [Vulcanimicrobiaceae bacterium]
MNSLALALVLIAAVLHATWNLLAKRASGGAPFVFLYFVVSAIVYFPVALAVWLWHPRTFDTVDIIFMIGNGLLHTIYFLLLQRGYRSGDLSLVYPLARGTGPLLASIAAISFFGERPSPVAMGGIAAIVLGVFLVSGIHRVRDPQTTPSIFFGISTGVLIAAYTLWDKHAMSVLLLNPILYDWGGNLVRTILMAPIAIKRRDEVAAAWRQNRMEAIGISILSPLAYLLVLWALTWTPVSYVAPARELSILFGTIFGITLFKERQRAPQRAGAAALMVVGIAALAHG